MSDRPPPATDLELQSTIHNRPLGRLLRYDNRHIWLPLCVVVPIFAYGSLGPLVARRIPRFSASELAREKWTIKGHIVSPLGQCTPAGLTTLLFVRKKQYKEALKADEDLRTIAQAHTYFLGSSIDNPRVGLVMLPHPKPSNVWPAEESVGFMERISMVASKLWVSSRTTSRIREGFEDDMCRRGISQHDIDTTVLFLGGALEYVKHESIMAAGVIAFPAVFVLDVLEKIPSALAHSIVSGMVASVVLFFFQHDWLPMHIHNKLAVAAILKERIPSWVFRDESESA